MRRYLARHAPVGDTVLFIFYLWGFFLLVTRKERVK